MAPHIEIRDLLEKAQSYVNQEVEIRAWVRNLRSQKHIAFITLSDGTDFRCLQVIADERTENWEEQIAQIGTGAALRVRGSLQESPAAKQDYDFVAREIEIEGRSTEDYPLQPKRHSREFLRSIGHLRSRTNLYSAVFRIRSEAALSLHEFFHERNFLYVHSPIITSSDAEGAGEMFRVTTLDLEQPPRGEDGRLDFRQDFFGTDVGLSVSGQLNAECFAQAFSKVYTFGPTFRAEKSNTGRHAAEFWMLEPEIAFAELRDDMDLAEDMLRSVIARVMKRCEHELEFLNQFVDKGLIARLQQVVDTDFARISYTEAIRALEGARADFQFPVHWGMDIQTEHERYLSEEVVKGPVFVTDYPRDIKAFYMRQNDDGKTVAAVDCLVPGIGELVGGSQREERLDLLQRRMEELGMSTESYAWYLDLRRYGSTKHAGFGLGFARFVMYLTGISNIRDVIPFPRTFGQAAY